MNNQQKIEAAERRKKIEAAERRIIELKNLIKHWRKKDDQSRT